MTTIATSDLVAYEGKHIKEICDAGFIGDEKNHCAHFVSHVLGFTFGLTCRGLTGKGKTRGNVRVHEIFAKCPLVGKYSDGQAPNQGLMFVTDASNVDLGTKAMKNMPKKHIGIYVGGFVWHYSNTKDEVVKQPVAQFSKHYPGSNVTLFYGSFPL